MLTGFRVMLKIIAGVIKRDAGSVHEFIHFSARFESEHSPHL